MDYENAPRRRIRIEYKDRATDLAGYVVRRTDPEIDFVVTLNRKHSETRRFGTLAHELGHVFCGHLGVTGEKLWELRGELSHDTREFEAEAVAYLVCERLNIDPGSAACLAGYLSVEGPLPDFSLEAILKAAHLVEEMANGLVRLRKKGPRESRSKDALKPTGKTSPASLPSYNQR